MVMYPVWWMLLKSPDMGAQTFLYAAMEANFGRGNGGWLLKECREVEVRRQEVTDEAAQKALWEHSERMVEEAEKRGALARAETKKRQAPPGQGTAASSGKRKTDRAARKSKE